MKKTRKLLSEKIWASDAIALHNTAGNCDVGINYLISAEWRFVWKRAQYDSTKRQV